MKHYRGCVAAAVVAVMSGAPAIAADMEASYPTKPVRVLVGISPGGAVDTQARWFAQKLSVALGRQFVIDNRSGAGGLLAYQAAADDVEQGILSRIGDLSAGG